MVPITSQIPEWYGTMQVKFMRYATIRCLPVGIRQIPTGHSPIFSITGFNCKSELIQGGLMAIPVAVNTARINGNWPRINCHRISTNGGFSFRENTEGSFFQLLRYLYVSDGTKDQYGGNSPRRFGHSICLCGMQMGHRDSLRQHQSVFHLPRLHEPPPHDLTYTRSARTSTSPPQHWLLFHMGLY